MWGPYKNTAETNKIAYDYRRMKIQDKLYDTMRTKAVNKLILLPDRTVSRGKWVLNVMPAEG